MNGSQGWAAAHSAVWQVLVMSCASLAVALTGGCRMDRLDPSNPFLADRSDAPRVGSVHGDHEVVASEPLAVTLLTADDWFEKPPSSYAQRAATERRWHHPRLDPYLHLTAPQSDLTEALSGGSPIAATNAAIVSAYWGAGDATERLAAAIRSEELPLPLRCAAAEALGNVNDPAVAPAVRQLLGELAAPEPSDLADEYRMPARRELPDLHADLIRALARHAEPGDERWFDAAVAHAAWQVRLEGVAAWGSLSDLELPREVIDARRDRDPRVRAVALMTIGSHHDPRAIAYLKGGLDDRDYDVRVAAVAALMKVGTDDARAALGRLRDHQAELQQAAAMASAAASSLGDDLRATATEAGSQMRQAVADTVEQAQQQGRELAAGAGAEAEQHVRQVSAQAEQVVADARGAADDAAARIRDAQQLVAQLREADLPRAARQEASAALERLAMDADMAVRVRAARAMGEVADPVFLPALVALLSDAADVQSAAMASLSQIAGGDVTARAAAGSLETEERVRLWRDWYRQRRAAAPAR